ncbi:MAG: hypothetical protein Kow002_03310 [Anaerolineales bacterium]
MPVTATATPTPTPTSTPEPPPRYFTEEFESRPVHWGTHLASGEVMPQIQAADDALTFYLTQPYTWVYATYEAYDYTDVHIETLMYSRQAVPSATGLICRYSEDGWYEFTISEDGRYSVLFGQWLANEIATYTPIATDVSEYIRTERENDAVINKLGLTCQEDILWLYMNDKLFRKLDVSRFGLRAGKVGVAAASFENVTILAAFEYFLVDQPDK